MTARRHDKPCRPEWLPDPSEIETEAGQDRGSVDAVGVVEHLNGSDGANRRRPGWTSTVGIRPV